MARAGGSSVVRHRNPVAQYGVDSILASTLFLLCLVPLGDALSLDARRRPVGDADKLGIRERRRRAWGFACLRLIQFQVAVMFFFTGVEKVRGDAWWHGYAVWMALTNQEFSNVPIGWLASHFWIVNLLTQMTMFFEVAYPFLIWGRAHSALLPGRGHHPPPGDGGPDGLYLFSFVMHRHAPVSFCGPSGSPPGRGGGPGAAAAEPEQVRPAPDHVTPTIHNFEIELSNVDRNVYERLALRVVRHPSEAEDYLVTRVLAYCLEYTDASASRTGSPSLTSPARRTRSNRRDARLDRHRRAGRRTHAQGRQGRAARRRVHAQGPGESRPLVGGERIHRWRTSTLQRARPAPDRAGRAI